jgi:4-carboxymuconolactone decarboxylase
MTRAYAPKNPALFDQGLSTRREVLGAEYVDASIQNATDFNMAMITALNRPHELKLHVRGAINNGLSKDEIKEVFLQTAIYCGVPAAIDSFRVASEVFKEMDL